MTARAIDRIEGAAKVTGAAEYAADLFVQSMVHACLVTSTIASGRVNAIDASSTLALAGVIGVITHENALQLAPAPTGQLPFLLQDNLILYSGQPIAVVIAETLERARAGAERLTVQYEAAPLVPNMAAGRESFIPPNVAGTPAEARRGDAERVLAEAEVRHEAVYTTPMQSHQALEPHAALASWNGDTLTVHATVQGVQATRDVLAAALGIPADRIKVISRLLGGGFGSKGRSWWPCLTLAVMAARHVGRPVMLELTRSETFRSVGCRAASVHHIALGAKRDGTLTALAHATTAQGSFHGEFSDAHGAMSRMFYACPNALITHRVVRINGPHPTPMRAPGYGPGSFALESAMDELAFSLGIDPLELRLRNHAERDPHTGLPWSSKSLRQCYARGAEKFGWSYYALKPRSMREGHRLIGWGLASAAYPAHRNPAAAQARLEADGAVVVQSATHDMGTGTYTVMAEIAAAALDLPVERVRFELGDSSLPLAPRTAGSWGTASVAPVVALASQNLRCEIIAAACADPDSPLHRCDTQQVQVRDGRLFVDGGSSADTYAAIAARRDKNPIEAWGELGISAAEPDRSMHAFGANFVEVAVDEDIGELRVRRIVACYAAGHILNDKMAHSQMIGGLVLGVGMTLGETCLVDSHLARMVNASLNGYLVPVNADIASIDVSFVEEDDPHVNPTGVKGIGMLGTVGIAAAIANAVFHATGKRIRDLPISAEKLM